ncbi:hypothetical protein BEL04_18075 [Mucilaginibacter sp. PPCGB 2223]|uniref:helix-turn-helix domain-containing protein n=1 Tax=Mucilaginibacter sp. PPCGB 2223 TaxID=1886027 RepID=UPI000825C494|nr:helix-turn-helix transcriptional regulator [Mucilaginibacter sp. PPCGB 2223]OCX51910.1 hypothetical protein BEL04_18075 [Mucilaginibacter sp. PPCGB 2223]
MAKSLDNDGIKAFGQSVRKFRQAKKLSMQKLADIAEIEQSQIVRIEGGKINTKLSTILIIAKALGIEPADLFKS